MDSRLAHKRSGVSGRRSRQDIRTGVPGTPCPEQATEAEDTEKDDLYKDYCDHAKKEDEQLIDKYTDDISGLLTFAGLLSAIITAFLLVEQTDFKVHSTATTNVLLYHIYLKLDNNSQSALGGTLGSVEPDMFGVKPSELDTVVVALYYTSLSFSLVSAFGGLVSKQWIMHYGYLPPWADDVEQKAHLRRMRHQGLKIWGFYILMGLIPLLIQISLLLFAIGVLLSSRPGGVVWIIMAVFTTIGALFWLTTLTLGTLAPSSPFKSPTSDALFQILFWVRNVHLYYYRFINWIASSLGFLRRYRILVARRQLLENWDQFQKRWGEESCLNDQAILAGIRWWKLRQDLGWKSPLTLTNNERMIALRCYGKRRTKAENEEYTALAQQHTQVVQKIVGHDRLILRWGTAVLNRCKAQSLSESSRLKIQVEVLCDFIYNVPAAAPFLQSVLLCRAIRQSQGRKDNQPLEISTMTETTVAIYFRGLLCAGIGQGSRENSVGIEPALMASQMKDGDSDMTNDALLAENNITTSPLTTIRTLPHSPVLEETEVGGTISLPQLKHQHSRGLEANHAILGLISRPMATRFLSKLGVSDLTETHDGWIRGNGRQTLCKELCAFLDKHQFNPEYADKYCVYDSLQQSIEDITATIALASIVVVSDVQTGWGRKEYIFKRGKLAQTKPYRQLSRAWERLSHLDLSELQISEELLWKDLCELILASLSASATLLADTKAQSRFARYADLEEKYFPLCLKKLNKLAESHSPDFQARVSTLRYNLYQARHKFSRNTAAQLDAYAPTTEKDMTVADVEVSSGDEPSPPASRWDGALRLVLRPFRIGTRRSDLASEAPYDVSILSKDGKEGV